MKLVSLNTWGGRVHTPLMNFFKEKHDIDIFCLQEIYNDAREPIVENLGDNLNLLSDIEKILDTHTSYFRPSHLSSGLSILIRKDLEVVDEGDLFVYKEKGFISVESGNHARNIQYINIESDRGRRTIVNFHGLWTGTGKSDTEERLTQSDNIVNFLKTVSNPLVLCGDFNLRPDTVSLQKIENFGLKNLIREHGITSTRTRFYKKTPEKFADYTFVSPNIKVNDFKILPDEVSDHAAMYLDFE